jgi:heme-degrading monooxygenase HmoA
MIVVVFRSRLAPGVGDDYETTAARMDALAAKMPGYVSHKGFVADDGERVTIVEFETEETMQAWRTNTDHLEAQRKGRATYYSEFRLTVCQVLREQRFSRSS